MPPFDNAKARQAISAALNRQELCDTVLLGQCKPAYSLLPVGMQYHKDVFNALGDGNINLAVSTFQELGYSQTAENPMLQTYLAMAVIGAVVAVVGIAMSLRRTSPR
jgi:ABC-type oligopeptide transport system substrate-binding subunit